MALKAKKPEHMDKRLKMFLYGGAGTGKTTAAIKFPRAYIIDAERGTENEEYVEAITRNDSVVLKTTNMEEVIDEIRSLLTEEHDFRTLVIDPSTPLYTDLLDRCEVKVGSEFGRHYGEANKVMKRFVNMVMSLDMNVIVTSHSKTEYGQNLQKLGITFDSWKKFDYLFDLVLQLDKRGPKRFAQVVKTRLPGFPDGDSFEWSYQAFLERYGAQQIERKANVVALADAAQVDRIRSLLERVKLPAGTVEKWFTKAGVDRFEDMKAEDLAKCINYCESVKEAA